MTNKQSPSSCTGSTLARPYTALPMQDSGSSEANQRPKLLLSLFFPWLASFALGGRRDAKISTSSKAENLFWWSLTKPTKVTEFSFSSLVFILKTLVITVGNMNSKAKIHQKVRNVVSAILGPTDLAVFSILDLVVFTSNQQSECAWESLQRPRTLYIIEACIYTCSSNCTQRTKME